MIALALLAALTAQEPAGLLRCAEGSVRPCLTTRVDLDAEVARRFVGLAPDAVATGWRGRFRGDTALAVLARSVANPSRPSRVLVVLDVSGSMKGEKNGTARFVLKQFLRRLDSVPGLEVAVAPFGSVEVESRIAEARFGPPGQTLAAVDRLPAPDQENTGLYSAAAWAAERLAAEVRRVNGLGLLVLITDGNNDIGAGDDIGLLEDPDGLTEANRRVEGSPVGVGILGIGDLDGTKLRRLAGARGEVFAVSARPGVIELSEPLDRFARMLRGTWDLTISLGGTDRAELGRGFNPLWLYLTAAGDPVSLPAVGWRPPLVALPAFEGVAAARPSGLVEPVGLERWLNPLLLATFLLFLLVGVWEIFPRAIWPRVVPARPSAAAKAAPRAKPGSIRTDLKEAPPRKPSEITASRARPA